MSTVLILAGFHLSTAPRVIKEADALAAAGYDVTVLGLAFDPILFEQDSRIAQSKQWKFSLYGDLRTHSLPGKYRNFRARLDRKLGRLCHDHLGVFLPSVLAYCVAASLKLAKALKSDLTIVHGEGGMWVGKQLLRQGYRVGIDFEDWFSEDLLPEDRAHRPIAELRKLERLLLEHCSYCVTTSRAMADALAASYLTSPPAVIYNSFPLAERSTLEGVRKDRDDNQRISLHWFSQTIGHGRGLHHIFNALPRLSPDFELHIRGAITPDFAKYAAEKTPKDWEGRVRFHPGVPPWELLSRIAEHDIGLALEPLEPRNKNLTISNKILQYLIGGLAVVASDTAGQREVLERWPGAGFIWGNDDIEVLVGLLNSLADDRPRLEQMRQQALRAAIEEFCSERQTELYAELAERALHAR